MGIGASSAGMILSAGGAYNQAASQRSALQYQASVATTNAQVAGWQASSALNNGQVAEENQDLKTGQVIGTQRAMMGASGVDLGSGSPNDVLTTSQFMGGRDAAQIHSNAMMQAWGYRTQQQNFTDQSSQLQSMAGNINPLMAAGGSLLTGATGVAKQWDALAKVNGTPTLGQTVSSKWNSLWSK